MEKRERDAWKRDHPISLSGLKVETSAVFNLSTQFGGGKTHALTLLYHLAKHGQASMDWKGVRSIVENAEPQTLTSRRVDEPAQYVLEIGGGLSARLGIRPGAIVEFRDVRAP